MPNNDDKVRVQISYSPDPELIGQMVEVSKSEASALVAEGRARRVDENGEPITREQRAAKVAKPGESDREQPGFGEVPGGVAGGPVTSLPPAEAQAPQPSGTEAASGSVDAAAAAQAPPVSGNGGRPSPSPK